MSRLARALARLAWLDRTSEAELFLSLRDRASELDGRIARWRRRRAAANAPAGPPAGSTPGDAGATGDGGDDLDLIASPSVWTESERVVAFRRVVRSHVPGRYAGSVALLVPEQRGSARRDLWWLLVADHVEVHAVPGAHLTSITVHGTEVAEQLRACLAGARAARA